MKPLKVARPIPIAYRTRKAQRIASLWVLSLVLELAVSPAQSASQRAVFEGATSERKWDVKTMNQLEKCGQP